MIYLKLYHLKVVVLTIIVLFNMNYNLNAQEKRTFTFGNFWYLDFKLSDNNGVLDVVLPSLAKEGVVFKDSLFYLRDIEVDQNIITKLLTAAEIKSILFLECKINLIWFENLVVKKGLSFWRCKFTGPLWIKNTHFEQNVSFPGSDFNNEFILLDSSEFKSDLDFYDAIFNSSITFSNTKFSKVNFLKVSFNSDTHFHDCCFNKAVFENSSFQKELSFLNVQFKSTFNFSKTAINNNSEFIRINFKDTVNFYRSNFLNGVDLRRANFDSVNVIILEDVVYPIGKLNCYWGQLEGMAYPKISLNKYSLDGSDDFKRIERIYLALRDNYNTLGSKDILDDLMFELSKQRDILVGGFWQSVYGFTLGYGYRPWKFIITVIIPILVLFSFIWYFFFFGIIVYIVNPNFEEDLVIPKISSVKLPTSSKKVFGYNLSYYKNNSIDPKINVLTRLWYVLYFSGSVLLSIRFKREWIKAIRSNKIGGKLFIYVVTFEWVLGLLLYIVFASFVLGSQFNSIKGILGF